MKRMIVVVLAVAALTASVASAQSPVDRINAQERARHLTDGAVNPVERIVAQERARRLDARLLSVSPGAPIQIVEPGGFHWADAGIGAAVSAALLLLALGTRLFVRSGRVRSA